jgi:hypothetical protein
MVQALAQEIRDLGPMELGLRPLSVLQLVGLLQLACRHPGLPTAERETARRFIDGARAYFAACPAVLTVITLGDRPDADRDADKHDSEVERWRDD